MKFILIMTIQFATLSQGTTLHIDTAEFNNKESCLAAANEWIKQNNDKRITMKYICAAKGAEK